MEHSFALDEPLEQGHSKAYEQHQKSSLCMSHHWNLVHKGYHEDTVAFKMGPTVQVAHMITWYSSIWKECVPKKGTFGIAKKGLFLRWLQRSQRDIAREWGINQENT